MDDLCRLTATESAARIRAGDLSPVDLVEACLARIEAIEPRVKAWVSVDADGARRAARERLDTVRAGRPLGALHGVPVGLKDIYHVQGLVTTAGAAPFFHERPDADAATVARLREAGAIILGKARRRSSPTAIRRKRETRGTSSTRPEARRADRRRR